MNFEVSSLSTQDDSDFENFEKLSNMPISSFDKKISSLEYGQFLEFFVKKHIFDEVLVPDLELEDISSIQNSKRKGENYEFDGVYVWKSDTTMRIKKFFKQIQMAFIKKMNEEANPGLVEYDIFDTSPKLSKDTVIVIEIKSALHENSWKDVLESKHKHLPDLIEDLNFHGYNDPNIVFLLLHNGKMTKKSLPKSMSKDMKTHPRVQESPVKLCGHLHFSFEEIWKKRWGDKLELGVKNFYQKILNLEAEVADLKEKMEDIIERMAKVEDALINRNKFDNFSVGEKSQVICEKCQMMEKKKIVHRQNNIYNFDNPKTKRFKKINGSFAKKRPLTPQKMRFKHRNAGILEDQSGEFNEIFDNSIEVSKDKSYKEDDQESHEEKYEDSQEESKRESEFQGEVDEESIEDASRESSQKSYRQKMKGKNLKKYDFKLKKSSDDEKREKISDTVLQYESTKIISPNNVSRDPEKKNLKTSKSKKKNFLKGNLKTDIQLLNDGISKDDKF